MILNLHHTLIQLMQQCCNFALAKKYSTTSSRPSCPLHVNDKSRSARHTIGQKLSVLRLSERILSLSLVFSLLEPLLGCKQQRSISCSPRWQRLSDKTSQRFKDVQDSHESMFTRPKSKAVKRLLLLLQFPTVSHFLGTELPHDSKHLSGQKLLTV